MSPTGLAVASFLHQMALELAALSLRLLPPSSQRTKHVAFGICFERVSD